MSQSTSEENKRIQEVMNLILKMEDNKNKKIKDEITINQKIMDEITKHFKYIIENPNTERINFYRDEEGNTLSHYAASSLFPLELFKLILKTNEPDFFAGDKNRHNVFRLISKNKHPSQAEKEKIVDLFFKNKIFPDPQLKLWNSFQKNRAVTDFIDDDIKYNKFLKEFILCSLLFTQEDLDSLGSANETNLAERFSALWKKLESEGISGVGDNKINFWSGKRASHRAKYTDGEISSFDVVVLAVLFACFDTLKDNAIIHSNLISEALSKIYAYHARGNVNVYVSSNEKTYVPPLTIGNHFWNAELFALQELLMKGEVDSILIHLYDSENHGWYKPIDIESHEADILLFLIRREAISPSSARGKEALVNEIKESAEIAIKLGENFKYSTFRHWIMKRDAEEPKQPMPLGSLRSIIKHWKKVADKSFRAKLKKDIKETKKETKESKHKQEYKELQFQFPQTTLDSEQKNRNAVIQACWEKYKTGDTKEKQFAMQAMREELGLNQNVIITEVFQDKVSYKEGNQEITSSIDALYDAKDKKRLKPE